jgi:hypothetical protein
MWFAQPRIKKGLGLMTLRYRIDLFYLNDFYASYRRWRMANPFKKKVHRLGYNVPSLLKTRVTKKYFIPYGSFVIKDDMEIRLCEDK